MIQYLKKEVLLYVISFDGVQRLGIGEVAASVHLSARARADQFYKR
jgi:hypothetical protein